ncbi:MAG: nucleotide sugar dehydrogenase [Planctomycetota bacterium]|nr:nucleotide sugar dehydrogenase [Planctomycetota bacterium]
MRRIAVIGLGYVGLPVALSFSRCYPSTKGFDIDVEKVARLVGGLDRTGQVRRDDLEKLDLRLSSDARDLAGSDFFIVTVPTPIDEHKIPDLSALRAASRTVGKTLAPGDIVVYESTVYPGVTEEICGPILEEASGLVSGRDFKLGYSPERINPGDSTRSFEHVPKVISAQDDETLDVLAEVYGAVVEAGLHRAPSIRVAEAAKVIENVQRDLNIALMNELAQIFDRLGIDTHEVLDVAATKWNFHRYTPGLVGGHCIGVDPYYLAAKAQEVGIHPEVILAGRRTNDGMARFVAERTVTSLARAGVGAPNARVAILGMCFKEDVPDVRNSLVPGIASILADHRIEVLVHDPLADPEEARELYKIELAPREALTDVDGIVYAVPHRAFGDLALELCEGGGAKVLLDVKGVVERGRVPEGVLYWRL